MLHPVEVVFVRGPPSTFDGVALFRDCFTSHLQLVSLSDVPVRSGDAFWSEFLELTGRFWLECLLVLLFPCADHLCEANRLKAPVRDKLLEV